MPPRLPRKAVDCLSFVQRVPQSRRAYTSTCLLCEQQAQSCRTRPQRSSSSNCKLAALQWRQNRALSTSTKSARVEVTSKAQDPIAELKAALQDVQRDAGSYVNISRLQLALRGLEQPRGQETVRIAVFGAGNNTKKAKELVRLFIADPLAEEEEWERQIVEEDAAGRPILLRIGSDIEEDSRYGRSNNRMVRELVVSSPTLNGHGLEILILPISIKPDTVTAEEISILVPTMEIPTSSTGRYTPVTTPVHKAMIIGEGIKGAAALMGLNSKTFSDSITIAANLGSTDIDSLREPDLPIQIINIDLATAGLSIFRTSTADAMEYEQMWFQSGVPLLLDWLKAGTHSTADATMKPAITEHLTSLLVKASEQIGAAEARRSLALTESEQRNKALATSLGSDLKSWAELAHTELRDSLDLAFDGRRWRKLGWWKLFWRVDDVSMISSDILQQRFLTDAEKNIIYVAGKIGQASGSHLPAPSSIESSKDRSQELTPRLARLGALMTAPASPQFSDLIPKTETSIQIRDQPWPLHIPVTRAHLLHDTVPALQALAQRLVLQTLTISSTSSAFSALIYISTLETGIYEAGAVAALGIVYSLRRMQGKWETARRYWEGEVREEGRRAVRMTEGVVGDVLKEMNVGAEDGEGRAQEEVARKTVERAQHALKKVIATPENLSYPS